MKYLIITTLLTSALWFNAMAGQIPVGTEFTYQGELIDNGAPANGVYDLNIQLYNSASGGSVIDTNVFADIDINNGLVNAVLDFGDAPFNGEESYLQINVRPGTSTSAYEQLNPRQRINVTPYAIQAEFTENGTSLWNESNDGISYLNPVYVGDPNTVSSSLLTVDSAASESPIRFKIAGATRFIIRENGGTSIGANATAPENGLRVNGDTQLNGDLAQDVDNFGAIKAALTVICSSSSNIDKSFNGVNDQAFSIDGSIAVGPGSCAIDLPFDIEDRFFVAMVKRQNDTRVVSCNDVDDDTLICITTDNSGTLVNSIINILIY